MAKINKPTDDWPAIPEKRYFSISEASDLCAVKPHVLRYWEKMFQPLQPLKYRGNRRYYRQKDIQLIRRIFHLLYRLGYTIAGARAQLAEEQKPTVSEVSASKKRLQEAISELEQAWQLLQT
jgi:DNA-binding transcriptional MerR regulator